MVKFKDFSRPLSVFQVLFVANFIFKDFSRQSVYSSTFQACVNPENKHFLNVAPLAPIRFSSIQHLVEEEIAFEEFQDGNHSIHLGN